MKYYSGLPRFDLIKILVLFLLFVPEVLSGQFKGSVEDYVRLNKALPSEKVFLHTDRPNYIQGDTIWFKAYLWYGYDQIPDTISRVLYVDLLNPIGREALKRKLLINDGTSQGDFILDSTISPGKYTLRAYTRWMQNINTGEPFYQSITISPSSQNFQVECNPVIIKQPGNDSLQVSFRFFEMDQAGDLRNSVKHKVNYSLKIGEQPMQTGEIQTSNTKQQVVKYRISDQDKNDSVAIFGLSIQDDCLNFEKQFRIPLQERIDLQFFPEGGNMVTGLESKIAFKAIGMDGLGFEVKGVIKDNDENEITSFESTHRGMGLFMLKPETQRRYFAHLLFNDHQYIIPVPPAMEEGCVMSVNFDNGNSKPKLTLKYSSSKSNAQKYIVGSAFGEIRFIAPLKTTADSCRLWIPLEQLPEGISRITVLDSDFKPECERLLYVDKNQRIKIEVVPDSSSYKTRSKVTLGIRATRPDGMTVQTDLSVAVVDKEQVINEEEPNGISDYKFLYSELKGHIEDAGYYFKNDSCTNYNSLDLLLLTQGYRKFLPVNTISSEPKFKPEKSWDISGKIKFSGSKFREKKINYHDINITLLCRSGGIFLDQTKADSLGKFRFNIPFQYGEISSLLQATKAKGKPFYSEISIDNIAAQADFTLPDVSVNNLTIPGIEYVHRLQAVKKTEISKNPVYGAMSVTLGEVVVTAKAKNWYKDFDKSAIKIADLDSLDPNGDRYANIYELLVQKFGARPVFLTGLGLKTVTLPCVSIGPNDWFPIYVINGSTYFNGAEHGQMFIAALQGLSGMRVSEIKRIMVLPPCDNISMHYADPMLLMDIKQSLVVIETYSNNTYRGDPLGIKTFVMDGIDAPRIFYSPQYDGPEKNSSIYDGRATLFWAPSIRTDSNGLAKVEFFMSDRKSGFKVVVNGIEIGSGNPGQVKSLINSGSLR